MHLLALSIMIKKKNQVTRMKKFFYNRNGFIHLYNPKKEGLGSYDVHYINAYKKHNQKNIVNIKANKRYAA